MSALIIHTFFFYDLVCVDNWFETFFVSTLSIANESYTTADKSFYVLHKESQSVYCSKNIDTC